MAEEEVLQEAIVPAKKESGGGVKLVHIIGIGVLLVVATAYTTSKMNSVLGGGVETLKEQMNKTILSNQSTPQNRLAINQCKIGEEHGESEDVVTPLSADPIIVNMADGTHYLSVKIAMCVDTKKLKIKTEGEEGGGFEERVPQFKAIVNDTLSRVTFADLFGPGAAAKAQAGAIAMPEGGSNKEAYAQKVNEIRSTLQQTFIQQTNSAVKEVYFESFLVQ